MKVSKKFRQMQLEYWIFFLIILIGTAVIAITPPLQGTDEDIHFTTVWKVSHGDFSNTVPVSITEFWNLHYNLIAHPEKKYSLQCWRQAWKFQYSPSDSYFFLKTPLTFYATPSYLHCIAIARLVVFFTDRYLPVFYAARFSSLFIFALCAFFAIRILPYDKWLLTLILLLPTTLFQSTLVSYDGFTYGIVAVWFSLLYRDFLIPKEEYRMSKAFLLCSILLCFCKLPYALFILSLSLIIFRKQLKDKILIFLIFAFLIVTYGFLLKLKCQEIFPPDESYPVIERFCALNHEALDTLTNDVQISLLNKFFRIPKLIFLTLTSPARLMIYGGSFLGCLGWLDCLLPPPILLGYLAVIFLCCCSAETTFSWRNCLIPLACGVGITFTIFAIFAFAYAPVQGSIPGITGRYFIPGAIFLLFLTRNRIIQRKTFFPLIYSVAIAIIELTMIITLLQRYYFDYWWTRQI